MQQIRPIKADRQRATVNIQRPLTFSAAFTFPIRKSDSRVIILFYTDLISEMKNISMPLFILFAAVCIFACTGPAVAPSVDQVFSTESGANKVDFKVETVASGLEVPWAFVWLPNGDMLFTERPGHVRIIESGKLRADAVYVVPDVEPSGESGLMDITIHPAFATNNFVYLAYAYNKEGKRDRVVRYKYVGSKFTEPKTIIEDIPAAQYHAGMRCRFGPDGRWRRPARPARAPVVRPSPSSPALRPCVRGVFRRQVDRTRATATCSPATGRTRRASGAR